MMEILSNVSSTMRSQGNKMRRTKAMTLLETVIALSIMAVVVAAVLPILAGIRNTWDARQSGTECVQNERILADHIYRHLAAATAITAVSPGSQAQGYIQFTSNDGNDCRYEVGTGNYVEYGLVGSLAALAGPVSQFRFTCYDANDFTTPTVDVNSIRLIKVQATFPKTTALGQDKSFTIHVYLRSDATFEDSEAPEEPDDPSFSPGVAVKDKVDWGGSQTQIDSYHSSEGAYNPASPGQKAVVSVNATGNNKIDLWGGTKLYGDAYIGPGGNPDRGITTSGGSIITGTRGVLEEAVSIPNLSNPTGSPFSGSPENGYTLDSHEVMTISSNRYFKKLVLWDYAKVRISGHVTILLKSSLTVGDYAQIEVLPNSSLRLYIKGTVGIWWWAKLNESTMDPSNLRIYVTGNNKNMEIGDHAVAYAVVQNPKAKVCVSKSAQLFGKIKAERVDGGGKIHVDLDCDFD
jgi:hypothetical protein